jgi:hypothetical protein
MQQDNKKPSSALFLWLHNPKGWMVGDREVIAEPSFFQDESSPTVLQPFARRPGTGLREINGDLLGEDFSRSRRYTST